MSSSRSMRSGTIQLHNVKRDSADYMNAWLKIKQESNSYPTWASTPRDKYQYVHQYKQREGIDLDPTCIVKNSGCKATAKLILKSFWSKFGENLHKPTTPVIHEAYKLFAFVSNSPIPIY